MFDGHQNGDFTNWLFRSTDYGQTWTSVVADLSPSRVPLVLREDLVDPSLLYLGTEFGLFVSTDAAQHWLPFRANLPTVPVNDIALHSRDNALVLGTHGRGIWILDDVRPLRHTSTVALTAPVTLAPVSSTVYQQRLAPRLAHNGDMMFRGENPANGVTFTVWSADSGTAAVLAVKSASGAEEWRQPIITRRGATMSTWNLRGAPLPAPPSASGGEDADGTRRTINSAFVRAGSYVATLAVSGREVGRASFTVKPDRRQDASVATTNAWHAGLDSVATLYRSAAALLERAREGNVRARVDTIAELQTRVGALYQAMETQVSAPSADMRAQLASYSAIHARMARKGR
jgi:hypothetical protein